MSTPLFIGDEYTAAALRLAGANVYVPKDEAPLEVFNRSLDTTEFLLLGADFARQLPETTLQEALRRDTPLIAVVPDVLGREPAPSEAAVLRKQLGWGQGR